MKFHFMKYRKLSYWVSGILVALSIVSLLTYGLNYGIDFAGGISMEVKPIEANYTIDKMRSDLSAFSPELQSVDNDSILIRVGLPKGQPMPSKTLALQKLNKFWAIKCNIHRCKSLDQRLVANWYVVVSWRFWYRLC